MRNEVKNYIRERLTKGNTLSRVVLNRIQMSDGDVCFIPFSAAKRSDLYHGGVASREDSLNELATRLAKPLAMDGCSAILENTLARASDPKPPGVTNVVTFQNEMYHVLPSGSYSAKAIQDFIATARYGIAMTGFVSAYDFGEMNSELRKDDLASIADNLQVMIMGILDGEGFLMWNRS